MRMFLITTILAGAFLHPAANAKIYTTDLYTNLGPKVIGVQVIWGTTKTTGHVGPADLTDLTIRLLNPGPVLIDEDVVIVDGAVKDIGGNPRPLSDVVFDFTFGAAPAPSLGVLAQIRNVLPATLVGSVGFARLISDSIAIPVDGQLILELYENGALVDSRGLGIAGQSTSAGRTIFELLTDVTVLTTSSGVKSYLTVLLDGAQNYLDLGNNKVVRSRLADFIVEVVKLSHRVPGDPSRVPPEQANPLIEKTAAALASIPAS